MPEFGTTDWEYDIRTRKSKKKLDVGEQKPLYNVETDNNAYAYSGQNHYNEYGTLPHKYYSNNNDNYKNVDNEDDNYYDEEAEYYNNNSGNAYYDADFIPVDEFNNKQRYDDEYPSNQVDYLQNEYEYGHQSNANYDTVNDYQNSANGNEYYVDNYPDDEYYLDSYQKEDYKINSDNETNAKTHLLPYTKAQIESRVFIEYVETKGRCLFAKTVIEPGEIIFVESPVLAAIPALDFKLWNTLEKINEEEPFTMPPIWHLAAIYTLTKMTTEDRNIIMNKFMPNPREEPYEEVEKILRKLKLSINPIHYQKALNAWRFNGFGHHTEQKGLILYNYISNMAHSCGASASWHYDGGDNFVLRARRLLKPGDEITISYIRDDDLILPTHLRREKLSSWQFICQCNRCSAEIDYCRGFLCPACATGEVYIKTDFYENTTDTYYSMAAPCTLCGHEFTKEEIMQYEELEASYINRLQETTKDNMQDCENVYHEACRVFSNHHVLYELNSILQEGYKDRGLYEQAAMHLMKKIFYVQKATNRINFVLCGFWEELGDLYAQTLTDTNQIDGYKRNLILRAYENAFNAMIILCGEDHNYTLSAHAKFEMINNMDWKDIDETKNYETV